MSLYEGRIIIDEFGSDDCAVFKDDQSFDDLHLHMRNHSPTGFAWGYGGSGPAQLALALVMDACQDPYVSQNVYMDFKWEVISRLDKNKGWKMTSEDILKYIEEHKTRKPDLWT